MKRDFEADRKICDAATGGEWRVYGGKFGETNVYAPPYEKANEVVSDISWDRPADATFIAEARTGWPAALDEIERNRRHISQLETVSTQLERELSITSTENQRYRQALESIRSEVENLSNTHRMSHEIIEKLTKEALTYAESTEATEN